MSDLDSISRQLMIIVGILLFIFGIIGNVLSICVFTSWCRSRKPSHDRTGNSALYLLASSCANLLIVCYALTTRILFDGYSYRVDKYNVLMLCQVRYYVLHTSDLFSLTCLCLATFDRYLISSPQARRRQMSATRRDTQLILLVTLSILAVHSVPVAVYNSVSVDGACVISSVVYLVYYRYAFQILLHGIIPIVFFSLFGCLTYRQLKEMKARSTANRGTSIDKQLSRMLLLMSITIVLSTVPYSVENIYYLIFADESQQKNTYVFLAHVISSILFYTNPVGSFYVYYLSTPNFRAQVWKVLCCKRCARRIAHHQVHTIDASKELH